MLGLRKYHGVQIDVWQGQVQDFAADAHTVLAKPTDLIEQIPAALERAQQQAQAHLKFSYEKLNQDLAKLSLELLRDWLQGAVRTYGREGLRLQRVTLIADETEGYRLLQSFLLSLVEDL